MKRGAFIFLAVMLLLCIIFAACSAKDGKNADTTEEYASGLEEAENEFGFETEAVTDKSGKEVTDANGEVMTTEVAVVYTKDKKGNYVAQKIGSDGEPATNKKGAPVTVKSTYADQKNDDKDKTSSPSTEPKPSKTSGTTKKSQSEDNTTTTSATKTTSSTTTTKPDSEPSSAPTTNNTVEMTKEADTTKFTGKEVVPKTSATGTPVKFSQTSEKNDVEKITSMLEVPYLYLSSYENSDGVPIDIATYTAVWMTQLNGETSSVYPSSPVVLNLFKFYGQTVVNFKTKCNSVKNSPIEYDNTNDTFTINKFTEKKQSVTITRIEDLGNNNFYKVTGSVTNAGNIKTVVAIIQKNKLESKLGFSIKALKWS